MTGLSGRSFTTICGSLVLAAIVTTCVVPSVLSEKIAALPFEDLLWEGSEQSNPSSLLDLVMSSWSGHIAHDFRKRVSEESRETQQDLSQILSILPRDSIDHYEASAVKYALHHFFLRRLGWNVKGLDPAGAAWNGTSPSMAQILELLPESLRMLLGKRLTTSGLDVGDTTVFALLIKHLLHAQGSLRLAKAYSFWDLNPTLAIPAGDAQKVLTAYMGGFVADRDLAKINRTKMKEFLADKFEKIFPRWDELRAYMNTTMAKFFPVDASPDEAVVFATVNKAREAIDEGFGPWQFNDCDDLRQMLLKREEDGSGRVELQTFYQAGLEGNFQFRETPDWLRSLGALDESSPDRPRVIIENYVAGASNAVGASPYLDNRCMSPCEALYSQLERQFRKAGVEPEDLAAFVMTMASATVSAPHQISDTQLHRLQEMAYQHNGDIPIAGRLFAQWMHHEYPRECPFPHEAGTTQPQGLTARQRSMPGSLLASLQEMKRIVKQKMRRGHPTKLAPWSSKEELPAIYDDDPTPMVWTRVQFGLVLIVFLLMILHTAPKLRSSVFGGGQPKQANSALKGKHDTANAVVTEGRQSK